MKPQRMELRGLDRLRYFAPTAICLYLALLCLVLIVTSAFLVSLQNAIAVTVAGLFGLGMTLGLGCLFWRAQRHDLLFTQVTTHSDAETNFEAVHGAAVKAGWKILRTDPARRLDAQTKVMLLSVGERVEVRFIAGDVFIASICDPSVGFSLAGRRHCAEHRELVRQAVAAAA